MKLKRVQDLKVKDVTVLVRAPLNVPIARGRVADTRRLESVLPTLELLIKEKAKVVLISHHSTKGQSLEPVAEPLSKLLKRPVAFVGDALGKSAAAKVQAMKPGELVLCENLRFHLGEEAGDAKFAKRLAALGQAYVDDDFTVMHRAHASVVALAKLLPAAAGLQVQKEVETISGALDNPKRPLLAIVGGAKISTKVPLIKNLLDRVDSMLIGGAMANTFLAQAGYEVGKSLAEADQFKTVEEILDLAVEQGVTLVIPKDVVVTGALTKVGRATIKSVNEVGAREIIADIGPGAVLKAIDLIRLSETVIWNGPVGVAELPQFAKSSKKLARVIADAPVTSIVGGGDTAAFLDAMGIADKFSFVSTGGGASLELMAGQKLPGLEVLRAK